MSRYPASRWLLPLVDAVLLLWLAGIVYRIAAGPIELEWHGIGFSFEHYRKPLVAYSWLAATRVLLPRFTRPGQVSRHPLRLSILVGGIAACIASSAHTSLGFPSIERFWSEPWTRASESHEEALRRKMGSRHDFIRSVRAAVPAEDGVLLETNERPYFLNYYLYPRRIYLHREGLERIDRLRTSYDQVPDLEIDIHPHTSDVPCPLLESRDIDWQIDSFMRQPAALTRLAPRAPETS